MKKEIKEILDNLRIYAGREENGFICDIEDYITNLQEENKKLKEENIKLYKKDIKIINKLKEELKIIQEKWDKDKQFDKCRTMEMLDYKQRNKKAIEYMNEAIESDSYTTLPSGKITDIEYCIVAFEDLLNILKGDKDDRLE